MEACKEVQTGENPRTVIRGCNSQKCNEVGVHWLRISFYYKQLEQILAFVSTFFGECDFDCNGVLGYDDRCFWPSGVTLNYDSDPKRRQKNHRNRITLDCRGSACDMLTVPDLLLLIEGCDRFGGVVTRLDVFFDDYDRIVEPSDLYDVIDRNDFSGFRMAHKKQTLKSGKVVHNEVMFGRRGDMGSGKYLRIYDKYLESKGEKDCVRLECEFTQHKAQQVFKVLAGCDGNIETFATICGALIVGCITFVHRNGDRNIGRLDVYEFWELITKSLGKLVIRTEKKENTLTGVIEWTERQVSPSLACVRKSFVSDQKFFAWVIDMLDEGESRMNANQRQIVKRYEGSMNYDPKINEQQQESDYVRLTCSVR